MSGNDRGATRRGAPLTVELVEPPEHLDADARRAFIEARDSRPGFWTMGDRRLLGAYALALATMERLERDPASASGPNEYLRALDAALRLGRTLRLTPHARGEQDTSVSRPKLAPVTADGQRPWQRDRPRQQPRDPQPSRLDS